MARKSRLMLHVLVAMGVLVTWCLPPRVHSQSVGGLTTPDLKDSLRLVNILVRRPLGTQSVRRECRMLNVTQYERITNSINKMKDDTRIKPNVYDAFAYLHAHPDLNAGAHQGPGFLPFHRVIVFLFEKLMRMYDPTVSLCYWDSTLEPQDWTSSATWTSSLFGNNQGNVVSGFAARWNTPLGLLTRDTGAKGRPFTKEDLAKFMEKSTLGEVSFPGGNVDYNVEEKHNYVHTFVGGLMGQVKTASYDPIFWFHHAYIDCIYEWFRQNQMKQGVDPMNDWPENYGLPAHSPFSAMRLGRLRMIDGTNNYFPENTFQCEDPPEQCSTNAECGVYMRCDTVLQRCVSDTLAVTSRNPELISDLASLVDGLAGLSSANTQLTSSPARGFNQLFQTPKLESFDIVFRMEASS